jgi:hypothetical protein
MKRITYLAAAGALVATAGLGAWAADAATLESPAVHVRTTTDRQGADDPAGHHRHQRAEDRAAHHRHGGDDVVRHQRHGEPEPGDDRGGHGEPEPGDDQGSDD